MRPRSSHVSHGCVFVEQAQRIPHMLYLYDDNSGFYKFRPLSLFYLGCVKDMPHSELEKNICISRSCTIRFLYNLEVNTAKKSSVTLTLKTGVDRTPKISVH